MRALLIGLAALLALAFAAYQFVLRSPGAQDALMARAVGTALARASQAPPEGGMRVFMCGTSSPLPVPDRAQACVAVLVGERLFIVDAGARSPNVASLGGLPLERLESILLTHFHSDHISAIPDFNLMSWVAGRPAPLQVVGPEGVERVVNGFNSAYELDRGYRVAHHGAELLPPELHTIVARTIETGVIIEENGLVITAFEVDHSPVAPAVGYRFDYAGRSVAITGDTIVTPSLEAAVANVDVLLSDALSLPIVQTMERAAEAAGRPRNAKIAHDIQDYHASAASLGELAERVGVRQLALYHLVPAPRNAIMEAVFRRDLPDDAIITMDGMTFDLPPESDEIVIGP
jgi:ribonuclease Z